MKAPVLSAALVVSLACALPLAAADIQIVVADGPGVGFNDPTPATPVGGNTGTTIGAQRLVVFQEAARIWGSLLPSDVVIRVRASFSALTCSATSAILGSAGPTEFLTDFANAPVRNTWYNRAQADKHAGVQAGTNPNAISARFNSELGKPGCLTGTFFYLGLDTNHGANVDLLTVVLHEFGHGLGFMSPTDSTGTYYGSGSNRFPGIYDRFLLDTATGKTWDQMTDAERFASGTNSGKLVWNGTNATAYAKAYLGPAPRLLVNAPASVAGPYAVGLAEFGAAVGSPGVTADLVAAQDASDGIGPSTTDGCSAFTNAAQVTGKIALVDRGGNNCTFVLKARNAQNAGAVGIVIANNVPGAPIPMGGSDPTITIPVVMVSQPDGAKLRAALPANANIGADLSLLAGADTSGRILVWAPNPYAEGSSISHFDRSASPSLLMEPNISDELGLTTDATLPAFRDMGWFLGSTNLPTSWVLPSSAHAPGQNNAFYTTDLTVTNTGTAAASLTLKFLGHDQDGTGGAEETRTVAAGSSLAMPDVLGSVFGQSVAFGAIRLSANTNELKIVSQSSTPPPSGVGTFGQAVPAMTGDALVTTAAPKALFSLRQDGAFRTNAIFANATEAPAHVVLQLLNSGGVLLGTRALDLGPLEMRQIPAVVTDLGGPGAAGTKDAYLVVSTTTSGARVATYAAVIDQTTNDPRTILPVTLGKLGANATWLLPSSAHAPGQNNAFYTTDLTVANTGSTDATVTLKFLGHDQDGSGGPQVVKTVAGNSVATYADVLGSVFGLSSGFGAILVTANSTDVRVLSQSSTPPPSGVGTFGQSVPAAGPADCATLAAPKTLVGLRQDSAFRTNVIIANATGLPTHVDFVLRSEGGGVLGTSSYDLLPWEMRQVSGVLTALGAPDGTANASLTVSTTTTGGRVATYAAVIDQKTNDPRTVLP